MLLLPSPLEGDKTHVYIHGLTAISMILNETMMAEMIFDLRSVGDHSASLINRMCFEHVSSYTFLGVYIL